MVFIVISLAAQVQSGAPIQTMKTWAWANYKIAFQAPSDLVVKESSDKLFYAGTEHVFLTIYPKKGENLQYDKLHAALQKWAGKNKVKFSSSDTASSTSKSRSWIYYVKGKGYRGMATYASIIVDSSHPENSYYIWLQYDNGYSNTAKDVMNSFGFQ